MKVRWLGPFAAGSATVFLSGVIGWLITAQLQEPTVFILKYAKPTGLHGPGWPVDPYPAISTASQFVLAVAKDCGAREWRIETSGLANDADDVAQLVVKSRDISNVTFDCLARQVRRPLISLTRKGQ